MKQNILDWARMINEAEEDFNDDEEGYEPPKYSTDWYEERMSYADVEKASKVKDLEWVPTKDEYDALSFDEKKNYYDIANNVGGVNDEFDYDEEARTAHKQAAINREYFASNKQAKNVKERYFVRVVEWYKKDFLTKDQLAKAAVDNEKKDSFEYINAVTVPGLDLSKIYDYRNMPVKKSVVDNDTEKEFDTFDEAKKFVLERMSKFQKHLGVKPEQFIEDPRLPDAVLEVDPTAKMYSCRIEQREGVREIPKTKGDKEADKTMMRMTLTYIIYKATEPIGRTNFMDKFALMLQKEINPEAYAELVQRRKDAEEKKREEAAEWDELVKREKEKAERKAAAAAGDVNDDDDDVALDGDDDGDEEYDEETGEVRRKHSDDDDSLEDYDDEEERERARQDRRERYGSDDSDDENEYGADDDYRFSWDRF